MKTVKETFHCVASDIYMKEILMVYQEIQDFGGINSICPQRLNSDDGNIFVGTAYNSILEGSVHMKFRIVVQGHRQEIIAMAVDSYELTFLTVDREHFLYKWSLRTLQWQLQSENECLSIAMHPGGAIVVCGGTNGNLAVLKSENGLNVSTIAVTFSPLTVLSYSAGGDKLAVGSEDGGIYIYKTQNRGYLYKKMFILRSDCMVLSVDWSTDGKTIQSVSTDSEYFELALWNAIEGKRMKSNTGQNLEWNDHTCTIGHNILGIWRSVPRKKVVYFSCHKSKSGKLLVAGDKDGFVRLFRYPCKASNEGAKYYEEKQGTDAITVVRFLSDTYIASAGGPNGSIFVWKLTLY